MSVHGSAHPGPSTLGLAHAGLASPAALARPVGAFAVTLVGMTAVAGWSTGTSLAWAMWLAIGVVGGLVAATVRLTLVVAAATLLVFPVTALAGRIEPQPDTIVWAVLVLVGGMVTAGSFAVAAATVQRGHDRLDRVLVALAVVVGIGGVALWGGYSGMVGASEIVDAPTSWAHCDTPASAFGWRYEAINYVQADDARLAAAPGGLHDCASAGTGAGSEVVTADGVQVAGWYIPAGNGAAATAPTIVIAPGWKSNKSEVLKYAPFFHDAFNLVLLDLRNQGRSSGVVTTFGYSERLDVHAMVDWLERTKHPTWIGAMGNSMGASTVTAAAAEDPRIRALILDSMHASMLDTFADGLMHERNLPGLPTAWTAVGIASLWAGVNMTDADPVTTLPRLGDRPVLLIHGTADTLDTVEHAARPNLAAAEAAGVPVTLRYCEGGRHGQLVERCPAAWRAWVDTFLAGIPELQAALATHE